MATPGRRPNQIAPDYRQDVSIPTADGNSVVVVSLIVSALVVWAVDRFVLHHAIWDAAYRQAAPILNEWRWAWTTFWHRFA